MFPVFPAAARAFTLTTLAVTLAGAAGLSVPAAAAAAAAAPRAPGGMRLQAQTVADLNASMRAEAFARASYVLYAAQAQREGLRAVARLFRRAAQDELNGRFVLEARLARLTRSDAANLRDAIAGEGYEADVMYPGFAQQAASDGDTAAAALFTEISRDEAGHQAAFSTALTVLETGSGNIPAPPAVIPVPVPAGPPLAHSPVTLANLATAMHGESFASAKYLSYAGHAFVAGRPALARLFAGDAAVELREHFAAEAAQAGLVGMTRANLGTAVTAARDAAVVMYPLFASQAAAAGDAAAALVFRHDAASEAAYAAAFQQALQRLPS